MKILGFETSCDDTSVAIIDDRKILSNIVFSQDHSSFGGVFPEYAAREHLSRIEAVYEKALAEAKVSLEQIDVIAATHAPGLVGSLLVGYSFAKALAYTLDKKFVPVHHIKGHVYAVMLEHQPILPAVALVVSGGHTLLLYLDENHNFSKIGSTVDDSVGEAYDKVGRMLGLGFPAGKEIDILAQKGEASIALPIAKFDNFNFSFSGLKSAVNRYLSKHKPKVEDVAASFQKAVELSIVPKAIQAFKEYNAKSFILCGGVAANSGLRKALAKELGDKLFYPSVKLCLDNGAMIAICAKFMLEYGKTESLGVKPNLDL